MKTKKMTILRLILFVILSFLPVWIMVIILNRRYGGHFWLNAPNGVITLSSLLGMFFPTIANLLTRLLTGEGMKDSFFTFHLKGNLKYYLAAVLVKVAEAFAGAILIILVYLREFSFDRLFADTDWNVVLPMVLLTVGSNIYIFFHAFGEEFGWRGYMMPKLAELMPMPAAVIVGGILWGLWHAPLTIAGHNFGIDYPGYPWKGILLMCLTCIFFNAFLTLLTRRSGSVFPAAICHSVHNGFSASAVLQVCVCMDAVKRFEEVTADRLPWLLFCVTAVTGTVSLILLLRPVETGKSGTLSIPNG